VGERTKRRGGRTLGYTPEVLAALDNAAVRRLHVLGGADDREGKGLVQQARHVRRDLVLLIRRGLVNSDALRLNDLADLLWHWARRKVRRVRGHAPVA
jgi:hypothetical protein